MVSTASALYSSDEQIRWRTHAEARLRRPRDGKNGGVSRSYWFHQRSGRVSMSLQQAAAARVKQEIRVFDELKGQH